MERRCTVLGAGVSGLTTAIRLREEGWDARIVARDLPEATVSAVAAAVWTITDAEPREATRAWALHSRKVFARLALDTATGVVPLRQLELSRTDLGPTWWEGTPWVSRAAEADLPEGYGAGWWVDGFIVETAPYLRWLMGRFEALGGMISVREVDSLAGFEGPVVNCTGLGASVLCGDSRVRPVRGQVVVVRRTADGSGMADYSTVPPTYVYPRSTDVIVGGTQDPGEWDCTPSPATSQQILARATSLVPGLEGLVPIATRVGLRPGRDAVRVEAEEVPDGIVIHNYGHGGVGYILSWGCAEDVVRLLEAHG